jgi:hypothetical protein
MPCGRIWPIGIVAAQGRDGIKELLKIIASEADARLPVDAHTSLVVLAAEHFRRCPHCTRVNGRGRAMRAWIDHRNDGLSRMPADGISLPPRRDFGMSRWAGSNLGYINHATGRKEA